jgi:hypothetical protein
MRIRNVPLLLTLSLIAGCAEAVLTGPTTFRDRSAVAEPGLIEVTVEETGEALLLPIDGAVGGITPGMYTEDTHQYAVVTARGTAGWDQGKFIIFTPRGERVVSHLCAPPPEGLFKDSAVGAREFPRQIQVPEAGTLTPFKFGTRRYLAFTSHGDFAPSALVVLEVSSRDRLVPRLEYWNPGHLHELTVDAVGGRLAVAGFANGFSAHGKSGFTLFVLDLDELAEIEPRDSPLRIGSPLDDPGKAVSRPGRLVVAAPPDSEAGARARAPAFEEDTVVLALDDGLIYRFDLETGKLRLTATDGYRRDYDVRMELYDNLPPDPEERLSQLRMKVQVHLPR